jgi:formylglycine-generating enzyme required for sulfatase activity
LKKSRVDTICRPRQSNMNWPGYSLRLALAILFALVGCARQYNDFGAAADIKAIDLSHGDAADLMRDSAPDGKNGEVDVGASDADVIAPTDGDATLPMDSLDTYDPDLKDTPDLAIQDTPAIDLPKSETTEPVDVSETFDAMEIAEVVEAEKMALVPASNFWMGCNTLLDDQCDPDESPQHSVDVPEFYIDITQVSVKRYAECVEYGPCEAPNQPLLSCYWDKEGLELHPMNCVTWGEASIFCGWAEKRLCTEAEWEKAARGGCDLYAGICSEVMPKYPWGDAPVSCAYANYHVGGAGCGTGNTLEVDSVLLGDSPYGTLHMVGNLWDWVEDCYHSSYENAPTNGSAWTTNCENGWSLRGGSFWSTAAGVRSSSRHPGDVLGGFTVHTAGIRCCKDP